MSSNFTLFQSDQNSSTSGNSFDQDAFQDISVAANSNSGFTDTLSTNPLGGFYGNDDSVRYGAKTLYIKDLVLVADRALWINGKPTYSVIWNESFPTAQAYVFGNIQLNKGNYVSIRQSGDGIGISGIFEKCGFLVTGDTAATASASISVDGAAGSTVNFNSFTNALYDENNNPLRDPKYNLIVNSTSNQTKDIHNYQLTANQTSTLRILGIVVYAVNSGNNIDILPGTTYVNKSKSTTLSGATVAIPSFAGSLGGRSIFFKSSNGNYQSASLSAMNIASVATGSTGTNLINVTTGTGASFPLGSGIAAFWGSTGFVGSVTNQSTDTLTVSPTLSFGVSGLIYKTWSTGVSLVISSSLMSLDSQYDLNTQQSGFSIFFAESRNKFRVWGTGVGYTLIDSIWPSLVATNVSLGFIQVEGLFSAADIEYVGQGILNATYSVNGHPAYSINAGQTGSLKKTVFTNAGYGWNSFNIAFGSSQGAIGINRINFYRPALPQGVSYGLQAALDTLPTFVPPVSLNATNIAVGTFKRYFADQVGLQGGWLRGATTAAAGGIQYIGFSTNLAGNFQYYGKNFALIGAGKSFAFALDGAAATFLSFNSMIIGATEGFHSAIFSNPSGDTIIIQAADVTRSVGEITNLQNFIPLGITLPSSPQFYNGFHTSSSSWAVSTSSFLDLGLASGSAVLTQRQSSGLAVQTAQANGAGIVFTPACPSAAYMITATLNSTVPASSSVSFRMTDGNGVIAQSGDASNGTASNIAFPVSVSGFYSPGIASPVEVRLQGAISGSTVVIQSIVSGNPIEWSIVRIA